jgi:hypothetical protein
MFSSFFRPPHRFLARRRIKQDANASEIRKAYYKLSLKQWVSSFLSCLASMLIQPDAPTVSWISCATQPSWQELWSGVAEALRQDRQCLWGVAWTLVHISFLLEIYISLGIGSTTCYPNICFLIQFSGANLCMINYVHRWFYDFRPCIWHNSVQELPTFPTGCLRCFSKWFTLNKLWNLQCKLIVLSAIRFGLIEFHKQHAGWTRKEEAHLWVGASSASLASLLYLTYNNVK